ncbi:sarcosine oxidase subunit delta [Paraburkholderia diazotrophica]|uniref:Sarcosine oxidase subunit delta n=1 Tax=Paraburkholderia diazotrophica TaxID=667676 RepID=A0A1H7E0I6_9BURK|nr:sarcosine oxidase subunit delta [Paraburkholderia diazotrophica]SEK05462.1 sarcosine oxidase subunit delta [Paraburkholderia diazotrophica]
MLRIRCPYCGVRDHTEFQYGGDATVTRPALDDPSFERWYAYVFDRRNPRGLHDECWQHTSGCRAWLVVTRDTGTHEILNVIAAREHTTARDDAKAAVLAAEGVQP